ncbi:SET and MYND domain-containing protein 4-like [Aphidius gifuensis]|uniref:SET and MYND domain-containing protein 4-like n=1 Tax=Aphidius gifuensis TaxID=684658 RepID=UPI001CDCC51A|nr:SET and MYND domain-containing protein 4-like [Aphidius gifuensis]
MDTLESEIEKRERVNDYARLWKIKLEAALTGGIFLKRNTPPSENGPRKLSVDPELEFFPTITINLKDINLSALYKKEGDVYFQAQEFMMAHKRYTQCITHVPTGSHLLAFGYANRSIALFYSNYMSDCLIDIERAIQHGYPDEFKAELYMWKASAMKELKMEKKLIKNTVAEARRWLPTILNSLNLNYEDTALPPLNSRNPIVPGLSNSVGLKCSEKYGRHIVATQDIKAGDIIGIQKPYASVVRMNVRYNVCWHCKKQTWTSIPCDTCSQVVFCSDECKKQAQDNYHDIECVVLSQIMAFDVHPLTKGFIEGKLDPTKFESVYGLCDPSSSTTANQQCITYVDAIIMSCFLGKRIEFFQEDGAIELLAFMKNKKNLDLIELAKKFINVTLFNAYQYPLFCGQLGKDVSLATLVIPSLSFFNHSCSSNVIRTHRDGNLAIIAIRPIKKGEQVFTNYGALWFRQGKKERHDHLERFQFTCDCEACEGDWSTSKDLLAAVIIKNKSFTHGVE